MQKERVFVIGGGPAGLMAAWKLAEKFEVHLFEKEKMPGRKFLMAGRGGLNITNRRTGTELLEKYSPPGFMNDVLHAFGPEQLREWLKSLGIPTFTGSSGKVFPEKGITARQVLDKIIESLESRGAHIHTGVRLIGFDKEMRFEFEEAGTRVERLAGYAVLAMGGASWPETGSDGKWTGMLNRHDIETVPFEPANCGINISWPESIANFHAGKPLKNISVSFNGNRSRGEALVTDYGLEGYAIYPLIPAIRRRLKEGCPVEIFIDFKPVLNREALLKRLGNAEPGGKSYSRLFNLSPAEMALLKVFTTKDEFQDAEKFADSVKNLAIPVQALRGIDEAISTAGGLSTAELNPDFSLKKFSRIFAVGEMIDWEAPTGGFLLQGCFASGWFVAERILQRQT